jgi:hypothetical protein
LFFNSAALALRCCDFKSGFSAQSAEEPGRPAEGLAWDGPLTSVKHEDVEIAEPAMFGKTLLSADEHATEEEIEAYDRQIAEAAQSSPLVTPTEIRRSHF